ncbi:unnamed protein product [Rotaria socialis]|uniref:Uncharacterized protein n=1 Tax=Rotaria socialis TaxID=392032 RepID=A0A821EB82_9BILA|nr:unnamed protein product [Rotaria socialis]
MVNQIVLIIGQYLTTIRARILVISISIGIVLIFIKLNGFDLHHASINTNNYSGSSKSLSLVRVKPITLCVIIRVHRGHITYLPVLVLALAHAGFDNIRLYVVNIDRNIDIQLLFRTIDSLNRLASRAAYVSLLSLGLPGENDFGFIITDRALTFLYNQHEQSPFLCQYVILTNGDNLYSQHLGKNLLPHMIAQKDIIAWDFVSRYYRADYINKNKNREETSPQVVDTGTAKCLPVALQLGSADLGAVAYRLAFLKQHKLHIHYPDGTYDVNSDGSFAKTASGLTNTSVILRQTLFIHQ